MTVQRTRFVVKQSANSRNTHRRNGENGPQLPYPRRGQNRAYLYAKETIRDKYSTGREVSKGNRRRNEPGYCTAGDRPRGVVIDKCRYPKCKKICLNVREVHDVERDRDEGESGNLGMQSKV